MSTFISQLYILCFRDVRTFIEANNDVILICTSILSFSKVLSSMPLACLKKPTTLFVDVLSVKEHPRELLLRVILYYFFKLLSMSCLVSECALHSLRALPIGQYDGKSYSHIKDAMFGITVDFDKTHRKSKHALILLRPMFALQVLPEESDILCTHPMFGPESGKNGWKDLNFMYDKVRIRDEATCSNFLHIFASEVS